MPPPRLPASRSWKCAWPWPLVIHYEVPYLHTVAEAWPWLLSVALLALATAWLLWRRYGGNPGKSWLAFAVGFAFLPTLFGLQVGQISGLMFLGVALFGYCLHTGKPFAMRAARAVRKPVLAASAAACASG